MKYLSLQEISDLGVLQELNRRELHWRGLALELECSDDGTVLNISGIQDHRSEQDGVAFIDVDLAKVKSYDNLSKAKDRYATLGYVIQPLDASSVNYLYPHWVMIYTRKDGIEITFKAKTLTDIRHEWNDKNCPVCELYLRKNKQTILYVKGTKEFFFSI